MNNSILTEIESRQLGKISFENKNSNPSKSTHKMTPEDLMAKKHQILNDLMMSINRNRIGKLSSILKSKYDWKEFLSNNKLKNKIEYHRKDGFLQKNKLKNQ